MLERAQAVEAPTSPPPQSVARVTVASTTVEKIALFRSLFRGREDVFRREWENSKTGKAGYSQPYLAELSLEELSARNLPHIEDIMSREIHL
jgi:hypothetical protein